MDAVQDRVEEPEPTIIDDEREHDRPLEFVTTDRVTTPVKPFCGVTVMVEVPVEPAFEVTVAGLAERENVGALVT